MTMFLIRSLPGRSKGPSAMAIGRGGIGRPSRLLCFSCRLGAGTNEESTAWALTANR